MCSEKQGPGAKLLLGVEWPRFREYVNANAMTTFNGDTIDCSDNENIVSKRTGSCLVIMRGTHSTLHKLRMLMSQLSTNLKCVIDIMKRNEYLFKKKSLSPFRKVERLIAKPLTNIFP